MRHERNKIVFLCLLLVVSGGWMALASRRSVKPAAGRPDAAVGQDGDTAAQAQPAVEERWATPASSAWPPAVREGSSPGASLGNGELFLRMMLSVGLILGLGAAAFYLSKRVLPRVARPPGKEIRVLETAYLGPRKVLHLVAVGGRRLLLASTSDSITLLAGVPVPSAQPRAEGPASASETWSDLSPQELGEAVET